MLEKIKELRFPVFVVLVFVGLLYLINRNDQKFLLQQKQRQEVVCPSFLSIARSARDTLIVMRNEPLCNSYVLDNLQ